MSSKKMRGKVKLQLQLKTRCRPPNVVIKYYLILIGDIHIIIQNRLTNDKKL